MGGASQGCTSQGLRIADTCRYNTFIGTGFENPSATEDVADQGVQTQYLNCYSSKKFLLQGKQPVVKGGYFERFELSNTCEQGDVSNIRINNWATGAGGWFDSGIATKWRSIYDMDAAAFHYPQKPRSEITVGASPFTWKNTTGGAVKVTIASGTVVRVLGQRGDDMWLEDSSPPATYLVAPGDSIVVTFSAAPQMSYIPLNGL